MIANGLRHERVMKQHGGIYARCRAILFCALLIVPFCGDNIAQAQSAKKKRHKKISANAVKQIDSVLQEKESRTLAQQKIDSQLLYAIKGRRGEALPAVQPASVPTDTDGRTLLIVDISGNVTDALLSRISLLGGQVISSFPRYNTIRANIPLDKIEALACSSDVRFIQSAAQAQTNQAIHN